MFSSQSVLSFFPSLVWVHDLAEVDSAPLNEALWKCLNAMRKKSDAYSAGRTWQTDTNVHELPEFQPLLAYIHFAADQILDFLGVEKHPLSVTGCWGNFGPSGTSHHEHSHPNNYLSGVYYVRAPTGGNTINFIDPRPQAHVIAPPIAKKNAHIASQVSLDIAPGRLILFPAWVRHSVDINKSKDERMSIAFNLMFEDFGRNLSKPRFKGNLNDDRRPKR